jgi:DNA polymerase V
MSKNKTESSPIAVDRIRSGFSSPIQDYMNPCIDLNKELVRHPAATFYGRVVGDSMIDAGVEEGDILVIDKALDPKEGDMAVCFVDGEFALRRISFHAPEPGVQVKASGKVLNSYRILEHRDIWLLSANGRYGPIRVTEANDFTVWGVVTYVIKKMGHK